MSGFYIVRYIVALILFWFLTMNEKMWRVVIVILVAVGNTKASYEGLSSKSMPKFVNKTLKISKFVNR